MLDSSYYQDLLRPVFEGRRLVLVGVPLAGATKMVSQLRSLGASRCLVIANGRGTGPPPSEDDAAWLVLSQRATDIVAALREAERAMADPPREVVRAIEDYDPDRRATVIAPVVTLGPIAPRMAGRPIWGRRPSASLVLEEKTRIDAFWDDLAIARAPSVVAPASIDSIIGAHHRMDRGGGTVMAGDARDGLHGGAHLVRWVRGDDDLTAALELFGHRCDQVRVMPFLEGVPCSIHGLVFPDHVAAIRPVELITLRPHANPKFLYAGAATFWDPPDRDREYMRGVARRVGEAFRTRVGTGTFTVDGVLTEEGFLPTELNPRFGAGLSVMAHGLPDLPLVLICQALQGGEVLDYRPQELERLLLSGADAHRSGGGWTVVRKLQTETHEHTLVHDGRGYRLAKSGEAGDGTLAIGPSNVGGFLRFTPEPSRVQARRSIAPLVVAAFALADREFGTDLGALAPARDVRRN